MNANAKKLLLNSFANGNLEIVKTFHSKYGNSIFDSRENFSNNQRLIFYAIKNGHFNIVDYWVDKTKNGILSSREVSLIMRHISHSKIFDIWLNKYYSNEKIQSILPISSIKFEMSTYITMRYDLDLIDSYLTKFPEQFNNIMENCGTSDKGKQLKRHLKLKTLI